MHFPNQRRLFNLLQKVGKKKNTNQRKKFVFCSTQWLQNKIYICEDNFFENLERLPLKFIYVYIYVQCLN